MNTSDAGEAPVEQAVGRPAATYSVRYLCDGYILADAFRPNPGWGCKGYTVSADRLGPHCDEDIIRAAKEMAPPGYWLHHIEALGGEPHRRDVFRRGVPLGRKEQPNAKLSGACTAGPNSADAVGRPLE